MTPLAHGLDLVLVLAHLAHGLPRGGRWRGAVMLTAGLPEPHIVGDNGLRLYIGPAGDSPTLAGMEARELLARLRGVTPTLDRSAPPRRFDVDGAGAVAQRLSKLSAAELARVNEVLDVAERQIAQWRERIAEREHALAGSPSWQRCPICHPIAGAFPFWTGTSEAGTPVVAEWFLEVLGAPEVSDRVSRGSCTKRCPWCDTRYEWRADYTYLVNGATEDETTLTRLD